MKKLNFKITTKIILFIAVLLITRNEICAQGIRFEKGGTWTDILKKAKVENKVIFLDCFATWCGPCKEMDQNIYPLKQVGDLYNREFVCVKIQMDQTSKDDVDTKKLYNVASMLENTYEVKSFPTFMFFSSEGIPLHKVSGSFDKAEDFIALAENVKKPEKQYYTVVKNFLPGKLDTTELKSLIKAFQNSDKVLGGKMAADYLTRIPKVDLRQTNNGKMMITFQDNPVVLQVAVDYIKEIGVAKNINFIEFLSKKQEIREMGIDYIKKLRKEELGSNENVRLMTIFKSDPPMQQIAKAYIDELPPDKFYTLPMILLLENFTKTPNDRGFEIFYHHADEVDKLIGSKGIGKSQAEKIIEQTEIRPIMQAAKEQAEEPDFNAINKVISNKYDDAMGQRILLSAKLDWYKFLVYTKKDEKYWPQLITSRIAKTEYLRADTIQANVIVINDFVCNEIFMHCDDIDQLNIVAGWMKNIVKRNAKSSFLIDTYACILYKAGKTSEAIVWEKKAVSLDPNDKETLANLEKMKKREKFWLPQTITN